MNLLLRNTEVDTKSNSLKGVLLVSHYCRMTTTLQLKATDIHDLTVPPGQEAGVDPQQAH